MRQLDAGQMPEQHAVGVQCALRVSRGAGGVDDDRRVIRPGVDGGESIGGLRQGCGEIDMASGPAVFADDVDAIECGEQVANACDLFGARQIRHHAAGAAVRQAEPQGLLAEQHEERDRDQPGLERRHMRHRRLRHLRQQDRQPVAAAKAMRAEHVGEAVRRPFEIVELCSLTAPVSET